MELASVKPDDIVRVNKKGRSFEAFVVHKHRGELEIAPIQRGITYTTASAREAICHWAKRGRPQRRASARDRKEPGSAGRSGPFDGREGKSEPPDSRPTGAHSPRA